MTKPESISTRTIQEQVKAMPLIYKGAYNWRLSTLLETYKLSSLRIRRRKENKKGGKEWGGLAKTHHQIYSVTADKASF